MTAPKPYMHLRIGESGVSRLLSGPGYLTRVGTDGCFSGVFCSIRIGPTQVFAAHLSARNPQEQGSDGPWLPNAQVASELKQVLKQKLSLLFPYAPRSSFTHLVENKEFQTQHAVIICLIRKITVDGVQIRTASSYIVEALGEFFELDNANVALNAATQGCVVEYPSECVTTFGETIRATGTLAVTHATGDFVGGDPTVPRLLEMEGEKAGENGFIEVPTRLPTEWVFVYKNNSDPTQPKTWSVAGCRPRV